MAELKDTFRIGQEVDVLFRAAKVLDIGTNFLDLNLADGDDLSVVPGNTGVTVRPTADETPIPDAALKAVLGSMTREQMDEALAFVAGHSPRVFEAAVEKHRALPVLASMSTSEGTWSLVETHTRPGGDVDVIAAHAAPGHRPVLQGFRRSGGAWQQLAGEWTDLVVARWDVARATGTQVASAQALFFLDAAMVGRTS